MHEPRERGRRVSDRPHDGPRTPWRAARFVVLDPETTGLDPERDEIIAFASIDVDGGRAQVSSSRMSLVRPRNSSRPESVRIHGLRDADLAGASPIEAVLDELLHVLAGRTLVAHAAWMEEGFLRTALARADVALRGPVVDTMTLGAAVLGGRGRTSIDHLPLATLAELMSLPVHRPHDPDGDALTTAQVFLALATHMESAGGGRLRDLIRPEGGWRERVTRRRD